MLRPANFVGFQATAVTLLIILQPSTTSCFSLDRPPHITATWSTIDHDSAGSDRIPRIDPPRSGHVAFSADGGSGAALPFVFGGYCEEVDGDAVTRFATDELWGWIGGDSGGWKKIDQKGEVPGPRLASAAAVLGGRPYLFGGWDPQLPGTGGIILDTVHRLDPSTLTWSEISATVPGGPTSRHVALALPGGTDALVHNHRCTDHVLVFDSSTETFRQQKTTGNAPSSRGLHCAVMCSRNAVVFGGAAQTGTMSNEAFLLDTESYKWTKLQFGTSVDAPRPSPRASPCFFSISPNCAILFGGAETTESGLNGRADLWALHFDPKQGIARWELLISDDAREKEGAVVPPPRNAASITEIEVQGKDATEGDRTFLLQGGWAPFKITHADSYFLNIHIDE